MAFETKAQVLEKILSREKPRCPHCGEEMSLWEVPPVSYSDGLGWGVPYLYICFNDNCPLFQNGWENMRENYGRNASYRCMRYPNEEKFECLPVFSSAGGTGQIIDDQILEQQEAMKEAIKQGFVILAESFARKEWRAVLDLLLDGNQPERVRLKAAEMIGDIGETDSIEPLRGHRFGNPAIQTSVDRSVQKIHTRFYTRECPFCAEIIKARAKVCKHCGKEVAGN